MFTIDTVVDQSVKTGKQVLSYVQDEKLRKELDLLIDAQAQYTKTVFNSALDLTKLAVENFGKFDAKSFDMSQFFNQVKSK